MSISISFFKMLQEISISSDLKRVARQPTLNLDIWKVTNQSEGNCVTAEKTFARIKILNFLLLSFKFSYLQCLSPFFLKLISITENGTQQTIVKSTSWLPQKVACGILTILDFFWIIQFVRKSLPKEPKNPAHHIDMMVTISSQLFKCVMLKKLWFNQADFVKICNHILNTDISIIKHNWLLKRGTIFISLLMILYSLLGISYMDWLRGNSNDVEGETSHKFEWSEWWNAMLANGKYNFFVSNSTNISISTGDNYSWGNSIIVVLTAAGLLHRLPL